MQCLDREVASEHGSLVAALARFCSGGDLGTVNMTGLISSLSTSIICSCAQANIGFNNHSQKFSAPDVNLSERRRIEPSTLDFKESRVEATHRATS